MNNTLVINPKGGSGKTTVSVNLASYFASNGIPTAVMDYDPQGSSLNWIRRRPPHANRIHGANAAPAKAGRLRSIDMHVPRDTQQLIIDAPAGSSGLLLQELLNMAHCIIVPMMPSAIDMHATTNFIKDLLLMGKIRARNIRVAFVANRIRTSMQVYPPLERFLATLNLPLLTCLTDSDVYIKAAESAVGIFEIESFLSALEREQFMPIVKWVGSCKELPQPRTDQNIFSLEQRRSG
ncbi:MAG: AAA family ATPase [Betaproteobacteria bacterium]|jgi:chromosome partitioning protein